MVPAYTDIAHFRAPFKNWPYLGMAPSVYAGIGATAEGVPGAPQTPAPDAFLDTEKSGVRIFKPQVVDVLMQMLGTQGILLLGNDENVQLVEAIPEREKANAWVKRKLAEGKTIVAGTSGGAYLFGIPMPGITKYLQAVKGLDAEKAATAGLLPLGAVLARPSTALTKAGLLGPIGIAAIALLAVGGLVFITTRKRRGARS